MHSNDIEDREHFLYTLEWVLSVIRRYPNTLHFGLAHISFGDSRTLGNAFGAQHAARKLVEILQALKQAFRKTDLVARDGVDFWILAPYTPANENITDKILGIIEEASQNGLDIADRNIAVFSLPLDGLGHEADRSASDFLKTIKSISLADDNARLDSSQYRKVSLKGYRAAS